MYAVVLKEQGKALVLAQEGFLDWQYSIIEFALHAQGHGWLPSLRGVWENTL